MSNIQLLDYILIILGIYIITVSVRSLRNNIRASESKSPKKTKNILVDILYILFVAVVLWSILWGLFNT